MAQQATENGRTGGPDGQLQRITSRIEADLDRAAKDFEDLKKAAERETETRVRTEKELADTAAANATLLEALAQSELDIAAEARRTEKYRDRAERLAKLSKSIHRSMYSGDIPGLLLNACLMLTGAKRGMYLTVYPNEVMRVRAVRDIAGYPGAPPSDFITSVCRKVVSEKDSIVWNRSGDLPGITKFPEAGSPECWKNFIAAPVVLMHEFNGVIIAADKMDGDFAEQDIEALLNVGDQATGAMEHRELQKELQSAYLSTVSVLADAVQAKDPYTQGHCELVSRLARLTSIELEMDPEERDLVCFAALLHDVGKIGVSDGVLNKPGELLPEEMELLRSHVRIGHDLLARVPALRGVADVVLHHHEYFDGTGYPDGLKGEEIPLAARIVSVVDAYCAMITRRSYKDAWSEEHAIKELEDCSLTQFDPKVVDAFKRARLRPELLDDDDDSFAECGLLPGFRRLAAELEG